MTIDEMVIRHEANQRKWDALPECDKEKRRQALAGWADRMAAEDEANELQVQLSKNKKPVR